MRRSFTFVGYPESAAEPNVVVDGSPNDATVLTLTHWPSSHYSIAIWLIDVASAGDFATFRDRRAARASMIIDAYADADRSPLDARLVGSYDEQCVVLYEETIPLLVAMAVDGERFHDLWAEEDEQLTASEKMIANGVVTIEEVPEIDSPS